MSDTTKIKNFSDTAKIEPKSIDERDYYTAMTHFYRGELGRIMVWRQRLDMTTNWAVITATGIITFALSHQEITHVVFMVANVIVFLLLVIEGRRYRYYDAYRARVRMLEAHFLAPAVMRRSEMIEGDWRHMLAEDLLIPSFKIGMRESIARRLKRNYLWIFLILLAAWVLKILIHQGPISSFERFVEAAESRLPFPPLLFWLSKLGFYSVIAWLAIYSQKERYASGEMERRAPSQERWKI